MGRKAGDQNWKRYHERGEWKRWPMKGTDSHSRAVLVLDEVERGRFSLDTVRAQATALREL